MNFRSAVSLLLVGILTAACGRGLYIHHIGQYEKVIRTYTEHDEPDVTFLISKWDTVFRKWRITSDTAVILYQVDTRTQICRWGEQIVPCEGLKRDPDMRLYIDW